MSVCERERKGLARASLAGSAPMSEKCEAGRDIISECVRKKEEGLAYVSVSQRDRVSECAPKSEKCEGERDRVSECV